MIGSVSKPKLTKGLSYVLKTSQLAEALLDAGIDCHVTLSYCVPLFGGSILRGLYWLPNQNVPYPRVYVTAGVVPAALHMTASEALSTTGLPKFIQWLQAVLALPSNSTAWFPRPHFDASYTEKGLVVTYNPQ